MNFYIILIFIFNIMFLTSILTNPINPIVGDEDYPRKKCGPHITNNICG
jgi:hypothetical protein